MPRCLFALVLFASPVSAAEPTVAELVKQLETGTPGEGAHFVIYLPLRGGN